MTNRFKRILYYLSDQIHSRIDRRKLTEFYAEFIGVGDLCFDVGANVGNRTDIFLALGAQVVCIEPQPTCVGLLQKKYRDNPNITIISKGLAAQAGVLSLSVCESASTIATFSEKWKAGRFRDYKWESKVDVPVTTVDVLIQEFGVPDFCKIDVEGFEYQVLQGLSVPVPVLSFEFTKGFIEDAKLGLDHLVSLGEVEFNYAYGEIPKFVLPQWTDAHTLLDELCQTKNPLLWGDIYARLKAHRPE